MTTEINDLPPTARTEVTSTTLHRFLNLQLSEAEVRHSKGTPRQLCKNAIPN